MVATVISQKDIQHTTLTKTDQRRLERLAATAGRTPQAMLRFVLRDGFAACEEDVAASLDADREFAQGKSATHASVMQAAKKRLRESSKRA